MSKHTNPIFTWFNTKAPSDSLMLLRFPYQQTAGYALWQVTNDIVTCLIGAEGDIYPENSETPRGSIQWATSAEVVSHGAPDTPEHDQLWSLYIRQQLDPVEEWYDDDN